MAVDCSKMVQFVARKGSYGKYYISTMFLHYFISVTFNENITTHWWCQRVNDEVVVTLNLSQQACLHTKVRVTPECA